jgi:hypothetical protein
MDGREINFILVRIAVSLFDKRMTGCLMLVDTFLRIMRPTE